MREIAASYFVPYFCLHSCDIWMMWVEGQGIIWLQDLVQVFVSDSRSNLY